MTDQTGEAGMPEGRPPEEFLIDPILVEKWFSVDPTQPLDTALPRVAVDMLYRSIENLYTSQMHTLQALVAVAHGGQIDIAHTVSTVSERLISGVNALRHFQSLIMAGATGLTLDQELRVKTEDADGK